MITTVQQHIMFEQRRRHPEARGRFSWLLSGLTLATKMIEAKIRRYGLSDDVAGSAGAINIQGETQQKLDVYANQALLHCLGLRDSVAALVSEENEEPFVFDRSPSTGEYIIIFDPLDGSSNIDVNVNVGTIFSILRKPPTVGTDVSAAVLQRGAKQVAAGYVVYGPSTIFVYTTGDGVYGFTLDPAIGAFVLSHNRMHMPDQGKIYSVNEGNADSFPVEYRDSFAQLRERGYSSRYIGSLVADFHRTLLKGGVFFYPPTSSHPGGKIRLLYEANPLAFIAEQAGGLASNGNTRILDIKPTDIHQRTPLIIGSKTEVQPFIKV